MSSAAVTADDQRFHRGAEKYAAYLETPAGRLRCALAFANLQEFLPQAAVAPRRALDLGSGTGELAVRLAGLGFHVTLVDRSPEMLEISDRAARRAGVSGSLTLTRGDVAAATSLFPADWFDVVVCHHVLEYTADPGLVLRGAVRVLRPDPTAVLSVVARNRAGEVLKTVVQSGDLAAAERALTSTSAEESLYGDRVRLFTPEELRTMLARASLEPVAERGVRIVFDFLPAPAARDADPSRVVALERALGARAEFSAIARYTQVLARRSIRPHACAEGGAR